MDLHDQAAAGAEAKLEAGVMGGRDRSDDGESKAMPVGVRRAIIAKALERLEESVDLGL